MSHPLNVTELLAAAGGKEENPHRRETFPRRSRGAGKRLVTHGTEETLDALFQGKVRIFQSRRGYRFSFDAILLADFVDVRGMERVVDLGTGNGVIPFVLALLHPSLRITGVEIQPAMVDRATRGVVLNQVEDRVKIVQGDVGAISAVFPPRSFDLVVCNPPFRKAQSGRVSPDFEKKVARHEVKASLHDFLYAGAYLLPDKGRFAIVYPAFRLVELLRSMKEANLEPKRARMVHSFGDDDAALVLAEGVKGGKSALKIQPPLVVYDKKKRYTNEVAALLSGRRLHKRNK